MAKQRLSKLQKLILKYLNEYGEIPKYGYKRNKRAYYRDVLDYCGAKLGKTYKLRGYPFDKNFRSVFSQSIRNMAKKGLVELEYEHKRGKSFQRRICKDRNPENGKPCKDCPYLKKYDIKPESYTFAGETAYEHTFFVECNMCVFLKHSQQHTRKVSKIRLLEENKL